MRTVKYALLAIAGILIPGPGIAQNETPEVRAKLLPCYQSVSGAQPSAVIAACTSLLDDKSWTTARLGGIYMSRANAYDMMNDAAHALQDYNQAIAIDPGKAVYFYNRGYLYFRRGENELAEADFAQTVRLDSSIAPAHFYLGVLSERNGDFAGAVSQLNNTIALSPKTAQAYLARAAAEGKLGQGDKAVADIKTAISIDPSLAKSVSVDGKPPN